MKRTSERHRERLSSFRRDDRALEKPPGWIEREKDDVHSTRIEINLCRVRGYGEAEDLTIERIPCLQDCEISEREGDRVECYRATALANR